MQGTIFSRLCNRKKVQSKYNGRLAQLADAAGSNPDDPGSSPGTATIYTLIAQLNRALGYEPRGCGFDSY